MEIDPSLPDRHVGSMLSGEEVERLRQAIGWLRENRGLRLKDLALGCIVFPVAAKGQATNGLP